LGRDHALGDQQALSALIQFSQEERYLLDLDKKKAPLRALSREFSRP
jgi:hypothetical protein